VVTPATVPGVSVIGTATAGDASATVTWTAPASDGGSAITNYLISAYVGGTATISVGVGNVTSDTVSGLTNGTAYTFTVSAMNAVGFGASSPHSNAVTPDTVPGVPLIGTATAGDTSATVTWTAPASNGGSAITGYTITASDSTTPANGGQTCTWTTGPLTCAVTGLTNGDSYSFTVTATNGVGTGASSGTSNAVTPATVPGVPVIGTATAGDASATVNWTAPASNGSPITNYDITTYVDGTPEATVTVGSVTSDIVSGLTNGTAYTFAVSAINAVGEGLLSSNSNSVTPDTVPGVPVIGTAIAGDAGATVTWTAPVSDGGSAITGYSVTAADSTTPANGGQTCTWTTGPLTCSVSGLTNGDSYSFTVTATNGVGTGASSGVSNAVTPDTVPGVPVIGTATAGDAGATVTWTAPVSDGGSAITGYSVTAADSTTPANGGQTCTWTTGPLTCSVTGLTNGDSYSFTVTATNGVGTGASSGVSNAVTPAAPVSSLTIINGSGNSGRADAGDQIIVTFATPPTPSAFCSLWSSSSYPDLTGGNVVVAAQPILLGDDEITSVDDSSCSGGFHFGTIDLGQIGYFNTAVTFTHTTIHWDGIDTLTITLGTPSIGDPTQNNPGVAVYTPDPALGVSGMISSPSEVQF
jgi:trimeric autotransporter adhesin